jgi:selenocysteine lyase/cysteine desulfurase
VFVFVTHPCASAAGQTGTRSADNFIALGAAIAYLNAFGMREVEAYNLGLRNQAHAAVVALGIPGLTPLSPSPDAGNRVLWSPLLTVALPAGLTSPRVAAALLAQV